MWARLPTPGHTVFVSFSMFFIFLATVQVLQCVCVTISTFFRFSHHNPGPTVCISHISRFSLFLTIIQVLQCVFPILHVLQCFSPYAMSYSVSYSFPLFVNCLAIFQVLQCEFLIFLVGQLAPHIPGTAVCISHFSSFSVFLTIFWVPQVCVSHFPCLSVFSP